MKLFYYDTKDQKVMGFQDMGDLTKQEVDLVNKVLDFLADNLITDGRYKNLVLCEDIDVIYDDGESQLVLRDVK